MYIIFVCQFLQMQSHCKNLELPHCQWPNNIENFNKSSQSLCQQTCRKVRENKGKFGLKRRNKPLFFYNGKINSCNVLQANINVPWNFVLSFSQVNFWLKNLMYSTAAVAPSKFKKKVYNRNQWIKSSSECCWKENLQLKVGALTQQPKNGWT